MDSETRDALLRAIARSRGWLDSILSGAAASFDELAAAENLAERHVRFLMPLAFLSPRIVGVIAWPRARAAEAISCGASGAARLNRREVMGIPSVQVDRDSHPHSAYSEAKPPAPSSLTASSREYI
jgi:hypothetical protein